MTDTRVCANCGKSLGDDKRRKYCSRHCFQVCERDKPTRALKSLATPVLDTRPGAIARYTHVTYVVIDGVRTKVKSDDHCRVLSVVAPGRVRVEIKTPTGARAKTVDASQLRTPRTVLPARSWHSDLRGWL